MKNLIFVIFLISCVFSKKFEFGIATSAMQIEGAWLEDGRTPTVWDNYAHTKGIVQDGTTADIAADSYHKYAEDIALMKEAGIKHYRMSIQWTRVLPGGVAGSPINFKAVEHYRKFLTMLKENDIIAYANIYHNDIPAILAINGTGKADPEFPIHYANYAEICFKYFGDLVPIWFTFDEPWCQSVYEFSLSSEANTKPYIIAHNLLLAHSEAAYIYRTKYKKLYNGKIGLNLIGEMAWPLDPNNELDVQAAKRRLMFQLGWFAEPIFKGDYPEIMKKIVGDRLPKFTYEQKLKVKYSIDFFAVNHYYSYMVKDGGYSTKKSYWSDINVTTSYKKEWKMTDMDWPIVPEGMHDLIEYIYKNWVNGTNFEIWITENGLAVNEPNISKSLNDFERIEFMYGYLKAIGQAIQEKIPVTRYFTWSLLDNFEWGSGLSKRFGLTRIEYSENPKRIPKSSLLWYEKLINFNQ